MRHCDGGEIVIDGCSEFCATTTDEEKEAFTTLKAGDFGVYPCSECGCAMEDEYEPGSYCSGCAPKVRIRELEARIAKLEADQSVECATCGTSLTLVCKDGTLVIEPCKECLSRKYQQGYRDGFDDMGWVDG